jgi:hypothetical protein
VDEDKIKNTGSEVKEAIKIGGGGGGGEEEEEKGKEHKGRNNREWGQIMILCCLFHNLRS